MENNNDKENESGFNILGLRMGGLIKWIKKLGFRIMKVIEYFKIRIKRKNGKEKK
jgi:hypothetical protein